MIDDPYRVLGVSRDATPEQIKSAYRRRSKECHPDLHPDDPDASRKMNDVNEAYDMLTHPEKYAARQASRASQSGSYSYYSNGSYNGQNASYERNYGQQGSYQGPGGWSSDFGDFDFFDMFFGGGSSSVNTDPVHESSDSPEIYAAIEYINRHGYQDAVRSLVKVPSFNRNARWYYLMSLAQHGAGNVQRAYEYIQKALELDRNNRVYQSVYKKYAGSRGGGSPFTNSYTRGGNRYYYGYDDEDDDEDEDGSGYGVYRRGGGILAPALRILLTLILVRFLFGGLYSCMFFGI